MCVKLGKVIGSDRIGFEVCLSWRAVCTTGRADENYPRSCLSVVFGPGPIIPLGFL